MEIRTEIPEAKSTDPDLSDADATLEFVPRTHSEPVIHTMELTEADLLEVQAAVAELEKEEFDLATVPVATADVVAHVTQITSLPPAVLPPKRVAPPKKKFSSRPLFSRQAVLIAAALGTWTFFVSLASLAAFGVHALVTSRSQHAVVASVAVPVIAPQEAPKHARFIAEPVPPRAHEDTSDDSQSAADDSRASSDDESTRSTSRFGILRFAHATNGALVDGEPRRVTGDALFLSCGAHRIRTSSSGSRTVRVPCGKTVTL